MLEIVEMMKMVGIVEMVEMVEMVERGGDGGLGVDGVLGGSLGGWIRARGLSCHCLVDSCPEIILDQTCLSKSYYLPISVCFGRSGTLGGSDVGS